MALSWVDVEGSLSGTEEEGFLVTLGHGRKELPDDEGLRRLALRLFLARCPLSPNGIRDYVDRGDFTRPPPSVGDEWPTRPSSPERRPVKRCLTDDWELLVSHGKESHIALNLLQATSRAPSSRTFGHPEQSFVFPTRESARMAKAIDVHYNSSGVDDVRSLMRRAMDTHLLLSTEQLRRTFPSLSVSPRVEREEVAALEEDGPHCTSYPSSVVERLLASSSDAAHVFRLRVTHMECFQVDLLVAVGHWRRDGATLAHVLHMDCVLSFAPQACGCGWRAVLTWGELSTMACLPWWVSDRWRRIVRVEEETPPPVALPPPPPLLPPSSSPPLPAKLTKSQQTALQLWEKSHSAEGVPSVRVTGARAWSCLPTGCRRVVDEDELVRRVVEGHFGTVYADELLQHARDDPLFGAFVVHEEAVLCMRLYDGVVDETACAIVYVDTLAVDEAKRHAGVGGRIFHDVIRRVPRLTHALLVVAQCLRSAKTKLFWNDKLDPCAIARSAMWSLYRMGGIEVQGDGVCETRGRWFSS